MENASQALTIAFGVLIFVVALTLCITSFGQATTTLDTIISYYNDRTSYTYIESSDKTTTRNVGLETVIPTMYRAYKESYKVVFYDQDGKELVLYTADNGDQINYIDLADEKWGSTDAATAHLDELLKNGLYNKLKNYISSGYTFKEEIGEYYIEHKSILDTANENGVAYEEDENEIEANLNKKRIITYTLTKDK